jgi:YD repeat-containing protein
LEQPAAGPANCANIFSQRHVDESSFGYDAMGRLKTVSRNGRLDTEIEYNELSSIKKIFDKNNGITTLTYDGDGRVVASQTQGGTQKFITYDSAGRPTQQDFGSRKPPGQGDIRYIFDIQSVPHGLGRLGRVEKEKYSKAMTYDAMGNTIKEDYVIDSLSMSVEREFDMKRRVKTLSTQGRTYTYSYDGGLVSQINDASNQMVGVSGISINGLPTRFFVNGLVQLS